MTVPINEVLHQSRFSRTRYPRQTNKTVQGNLCVQFVDIAVAQIFQMQEGFGERAARL